MDMTLSVLENLWQSFLGFLPGLVGAIVLLVIGWIVGRIFGKVTREILVKTKVDEYIQKEGHLNFTASSVLSVVVKWVIYLTFISSASEVLGIVGIQNFVNATILPGIGGVVGAGVILLAAYVIGIYFKEGITKKETLYADMSGKVVFWLSMFFGVALSLDIFFNLALRVPTVNLLPNLLMIIVGAAGIGLAIAIGLGLKDVVQDVAKEYSKDFKKRMKKKK